MPADAGRFARAIAGFDAANATDPRQRNGGRRPATEGARLRRTDVGDARAVRTGRTGGRAARGALPAHRAVAGAARGLSDGPHRLPAVAQAVEQVPRHDRRAILREAGYDEATVARVARLLMKEGAQERCRGADARGRRRPRLSRALPRGVRCGPRSVRRGISSPTSSPRPRRRCRRAGREAALTLIRVVAANSRPSSGPRWTVRTARCARLAPAAYGRGRAARNRRPKSSRGFSKKCHDAEAASSVNVERRKQELDWPESHDPQTGFDGEQVPEVDAVAHLAQIADGAQRPCPCDVRAGRPPPRRRTGRRRRATCARTITIAGTSQYEYVQ